MAASPKEAKPATTTTQVAKAAPGDYVGSETCATCHDEVSKKFADNPHTKMTMLHGNAAGVTCENCHGAGKAHVDGGGDTTKIFNPAKHSAKEVDAKCLSCHAGAHPNFERSPHSKADVGCASCHSIHQGGAKTPGQTATNAAMRFVNSRSAAPTSEDNDKLLKAPQPQLCFQCHNDVKPQFSMPFHHRVNEGLVKCSDCHDTHGTFSANNLRSTADQNAICTKCHMEKHGPFIFEHAPVKGDGCLSYHSPHGSQNARMLSAPNVNALCRQCHSSVAAGAIHSMNAPGSSDVTPCIDCHTMVHGSNVDRYLKR